MEFNQKFTIGEKVKITDIDNYKGYTDYYNVPELQDEYLSNTIFTITNDDANESELPHSKETFQLYRSLFNELVKPVMKKIEIEHGENARIIFNYFAIENDKLFLAFYEPIYYVDLDDYLNNTENIIEKLVEETEK
ncbi:hypothetical protein M2M17_000457 [Staphylococcus pseudintermedius]|nr:hypothetical protein [Staphylococcus pseudintermedius]